MKSKVEVSRMTRVPFGVSCSPFLLEETILHHLSYVKEHYPTTTRFITDSLYVDDLIISVDSIRTTRTLHGEADAMFQGAGMLLCKWDTNDGPHQDLLTNDVSEIRPTSGRASLNPMKVLGKI